MSKAKLIFKLPKENEEYMRCVKATDMASVLFEFGSNCRKTIEREFESQEQELNSFDGIERCFEKFYQLLQEHNIDINELYT